MAKIIGFDTGSITGVLTKDLIIGINKALAFRAPFIKEVSPIDSGDYISRHKIKKASGSEGLVTGSNLNDSDHAFGVEYGFSKSPVNWSKKDGLAIYNGIGANVMQRATNDQNIRKQVLGIIVKQLAGG